MTDASRHPRIHGVVTLRPILTSALGFVHLAACHHSPDVAPKESTEDEFGRLYSAWHQECETIQFSSNTYDYIGLASYRKIVAIGKPALPYLEDGGRQRSRFHARVCP